jgi:murein DD-endopeptidase MepM/ murein hydrolase activator NlpD
MHFMFFSWFRPKSQRYLQLRFEGFGPVGEKKENPFKKLGLFVKSLSLYLWKKVEYLSKFSASFVLIWGKIARWSKHFLVRKLIWSRGKLGRPIANAAVMSVAFVAFMFGGVFNSSKFVNSQEISPDYLSNVTDIIPQRNIATTLVPDSRKRGESFVYRVEGGDTISGIGSKFKISADAIKYVNNLTDNSVLQVGQELTIPPISGLIHTIEDGDSLSSIAETYDVPVQAIADFNYILDTSNLVVGTELVIPGAKVPQPVVPFVPAYAPAPGTTVDTSASKGWCMWPTSTRIITQYFSWYHNGVDIATPWGTYPPLYACAGGTVTRAGWDPWGLGLMVQIDHGNGYSTVYGHMNRIDVGYGEHVSKGEVIGIMGSTGRSTGPHVHFMVKYNGVAQNPLNYIQ